MAGACGYIGYNYNSWEKELLGMVNEKRVERGLPAFEREKMTYYTLFGKEGN